jgi:hypothetical protein
MKQGNNGGTGIFSRIRSYLKANGMFILSIIMGAGGVAIAVGMPFFKCPGDTLSDASKTAQCANDLQGALLSFRQNMDMQYTVGPGDYKIIFDTDEIRKEYERDGIQYTAWFHLKRTKEGCFLKFYKRGMKEPGHFSTSLGNYGSVVLNNCGCNGDKPKSGAVPGGINKPGPEHNPVEGKNYIWTDLGKKNTDHLLSLAPEIFDGKTKPDVKAGVDCRMLPFPYAGPGNNHMYFNINNSFLNGGNNEVWIVMEYFDTGKLIDCQYDSNSTGPVGGAFRGSDDGAYPALHPANTDTWKFHVWHVRGGRFASRCNGYDFRFTTHGTGPLWINRVWVFLFEPPQPFNPGDLFSTGSAAH